MKTGLLLILLSAGSLLSGAEPAKPVLPPMAFMTDAPAGIIQFYTDVNFAACFSTPEERKLVSHMIQTQATEKLPKRLQTVAQTIQRIRQASTLIDPQMVHQTGAFRSADEELMEITSMWRTGDLIHVEVRTRSLSPRARSWLVAEYEKGAPRSLSADTSAVMTEVLSQTARKEIHVWTNDHGRWVRHEAGIVLLKAK